MSSNKYGIIYFLMFRSRFSCLYLYIFSLFFLFNFINGRYLNVNPKNEINEEQIYIYIYLKEALLMMRAVEIQICFRLTFKTRIKISKLSK